MNTTIINQSPDALLYVENVYQGNLSNEQLHEIQSIPWDSWIQVWFKSLYITENISQDCEIGLRLTSDRQIQILNHQYRSIQKPTDVLAFAATETDIPLPLDLVNLSEPLYLGDIIISLDTAAQQAQSQNHSLTIEVAWLFSHGILHLLGWDHPNEISLQNMLLKQSKLIELLKNQPNN